MKISLLLLCFGLCGLMKAGEVQWGGTSSFKSQENNEFTTKTLNFPDISPNSFEKTDHPGFFDKIFSTSTNTSFDKEFNFGTKDFQTKTLDFYKEYPAKDLNFNSKLSSLNQENSTIKLTDAPWASRQVAPGFNKQFETKEYQGPEAALIRRDINEVYKTLNSMRKVPDHDLTIDEVRDLLNKDRGPALNFTEPPRPGQSASPQTTSKTPLQ